MSYMSIWKTRPHCLVDNRFSSDTKLTWAGPISTTLYGDALQQLCRRTEYSKQRLHNHMGYLDPCLDQGPDFWHDNKKRSSAYNVTTPDKSKVSWHEPNVMFSSVQSLSTAADTESIASSLCGGASNFCYLCSTMEEHERNHLHSCPRKASMRMLRARIEYIAPKPKVKRKILEPALVTDVSYKVVVWTGDMAEAGTNATVSIAIKGTKDYLPDIKLNKGQKAKTFCFVQGSKETFFVKGPELGELEYLTVEHDGLQKRHSWYLEKVEVTNLKTDRTWVFVCKNWLSLHKGDYRKKRDLEAQEKERKLRGGIREYDVTVVTGKKRFAGTDAKVYLTIYGTEGSTNKIRLDATNEDPFERGKTDKFNIKVRDVGEIKKIKIEHDGSGLAPGWHLDRVIIQDPKNPKNIYYFLYGGWLSRDAGDGRLWREIKAKRKLPKEVTRGITVKYIVTVKTGDVRFGGTDASVFIQFTGSKGTTKRLKLDDYQNNFERGKTDRFELEAPTVGPLQSIILGHDNFGPGAGWFVEEVSVRKYLTREEAIEKLKQAKKKAKVKSRRHSRLDSDEEEDWIDVDRDVLPRYEDYNITCQCWIAKDEEEGLTFKEFPVKGSDSDVHDGTKCKYEVTVHTGDVVFAGTDANVFIQFVGTNGTSPKHVMDNDANNFERNMTETFTFLDRNVGDLKSIVIGHDNTGAGPGWYLEDVTVKKYLTEEEVLERLNQLKKLSGAKKSKVKDVFDKDGHLLQVPVCDEYYFTHQNWLQDEIISRELEFQRRETIYREKGRQKSDTRKFSTGSSASSDLGNPVRYLVYVTTSDVPLAATDANVFIQFVGLKGRTDKIPLKDGTNNFKRGKTDIFEIEAPNVGRLEKIVIGHDNSGIGAGWHLNNVQVKKYLSPEETTERLQDLKRDRRASVGRVSQTEEYEFKCDRWLAKDQDDGSIVRELIAER
ncbi:lipoxygenase homology domain-containing protein 1-like [Gigantopelta aegis]|uniref:lipoxygenase homology domain-containing protein 1-like n=1 Tax=Gigantopelta aegis TaxID=1735272 RepID=UPI001B888D1E|nr:lipoxygenase homology domain-containing protein 1-like [Gigantopelta aegis]